MFLVSRRWYTRSGEQRASGPFLMVFNNYGVGDKSGRALRAVVRTTKLHQTGHFMMGSVNIAFLRSDWWVQQGYPRLPTQRQTLSGTYGHDGLPITIDHSHVPGFWEALIPVPPELIEKFWRGGGWNSAGTEGPDMLEWATAEKKLRQRLVAGEPEKT